MTQFCTKYFKIIKGSRSNIKKHKLQHTHVIQCRLSKYESYCYAGKKHFEVIFKLTQNMDGHLLLDVTFPSLTYHKIQQQIPIHKIITKSIVILATAKWNGKNEMNRFHHSICVSPQQLSKHRNVESSFMTDI